MLKAVKVRLYPNAEQKQIIASQIGGARYMYITVLWLYENMPMVNLASK